LIDRLSEFAIEVVEALGYTGVALLVALENVFPPIPSEIVLGLAGFVASRGDASLVGMIIAATVGSVVGAFALYFAGAAFGRDRLHMLVRRHGRWLRLTQSDLLRAELWFARRATLAVLVGRCVPLIRSVISLPAGVERMPLGRFLVYTTIGSAVWNTIFVVAGYQLGERWEDVAAYADYLQYAVIAAIFLGVGYFVWRRFLVRETVEQPSR
jgi:membrane protein DedA with SNARE-associated domain